MSAKSSYLFWNQWKWFSPRSYC